MTDAIQGLVNKMVDLIVNPLIALLFAVGFAVFMYGMVEFMWGLSQDTDHREKGKQHMLYGILGMFIMVSAWGILLLIRNTVCGFSGGSACPSV